MGWLRRRTSDHDLASVPRDVEALERVVDAFAEGVA